MRVLVRDCKIVWQLMTVKGKIQQSLYLKTTVPILKYNSPIILIQVPLSKSISFYTTVSVFTKHCGHCANLYFTLALISRPRHLFAHISPDWSCTSAKLSFIINTELPVWTSHWVQPNPSDDSQTSELSGNHQLTCALSVDGSQRILKGKGKWTGSVATMVLTF